MVPTLFTFAGKAIFSYWFIYGLSMTVASSMTLLFCCRAGLPYGKCWLLLALIVISALVGSRVLDYLVYEPSWLGLFDVTQGGEVSFGGIYAAIIVTLLFCWLSAISLGTFLDMAAPGAFIGLGLGRLACFCYGCCYGPRCNFILSVRFPREFDRHGHIIGSPAYIDQLHAGLIKVSDPFALPVFPIQLVECGTAVIIGIVAFVFIFRQEFESKVFWISLGLYGMMRFAIQWFRPNYDSENNQSLWNSGHWMALLTCTVAVVALFLSIRIKHKVVKVSANRIRSKSFRSRSRRSIRNTGH